MTALQPAGANAAQIEFWNSQSAIGWVQHQQQMDELLEPLSAVALARAAVGRGEHVLDIGCGCGATSLVMARGGASVTGIDISAPMLESARQRARDAGLDAQFVLADASAHAFTPAYDVLFSRFGVMFFADPVATFGNLRTALTAGGRVAFICWQAARDNEWMAAPAAAIAALLPPSPPVDPRAPGPFAFADRDYVASVLGQAGFTGVAIEPVATELTLGTDVAAAMTFMTRVGPLSRALVALEGAAQQQAFDTLRALFSQRMHDGAVRLGANCWIATARR